MMAVFVVIVIAFAWLYNRNDPTTSGAEQTYFRLYQESYTGSEVGRLGRLSQVLAEVAPPYSGHPASQFLQVLSFGNTAEMDSTVSFVVNYLLVREEAERLGLFVPEELITEEIMSLPAFETNGQYDPAKFDDYLTNGLFLPYAGRQVSLASKGLTNADFYQLISTVVLFEELQKLVSDGLVLSDHFIELIHAGQNQTLAVQLIRLSPSEFENAIEVTEEEIQSYYQENPQEFQTPEERALHYVRLPFWDETPAPAPEASPTPKTEVADARLAQEREAQKNLRSDQIADFWVSIANDKGDFHAEAAQIDLEVQTAGPFPRSQAPEALSAVPELVNDLFLRTPGDPVSTTIYEQGEAWWVYTLTEIIEPTLRPYQEARTEAEASLRERKLRAKLDEAASDLRQKMASALSGGGDFATAAAAAGRTAETPEPLTAQGGSPEASALYRALANENVGQVAEPIRSGDDLLVATVLAKTLVQDPSKDTQMEFLGEQYNGFLGQIAFAAWLEQKREAADLELARFPQG